MKWQRHLAIVAGTLMMTMGVGNAIPASAAGLKWTLQGVTFSDGSTADGSFYYDSNTGGYSNWHIFTNPGRNWVPRGQFYGPNMNTVRSSPTSLELGGEFPVLFHYLSLFFASPLSNNIPSTVAIAGGYESECVDLYRCKGGLEYRLVVEGVVVATIPEPLTIGGVATAAVFGTFFKRKLNKKKKNPLA